MVFIASRMKQERSRSGSYYEAFTHTAKAIVDYYADIALGKIVSTQDNKRELVQAADFLVKEARRSQQILSAYQRIAGGLDCVLDATTGRLNQLKRRKA